MEKKILVLLVVFTTALCFNKVSAQIISSTLTQSGPWKVNQVIQNGNYYSDAVSTDMQLSFGADSCLVTSAGTSDNVPYTVVDNSESVPYQQSRIMIGDTTTFRIHYLDNSMLIFDAYYNVNGTLTNFVFKATPVQ